MPTGKIAGICIAPEKGAPMVAVEQVQTIAGRGLKGDRYTDGEGSWNKKRGPGHRQVTLMCARAVDASLFTFPQTRRSILVKGIEVMMLIDREFTIGGVRFRGQRYCDPCRRPSQLAGSDESFRDAFWNNGGIIAEVLDDGVIHVDDKISYTR